ncbi:transcriptional regulator, MarR family [Paenibacillus curdlanolyticus YK9]|uniref:Transcriptional regulator, MarR family n=1 Tax=Paenibacillus curdlanolyticus YK9 TaxID=717606 RepID=E0IG29_9BACL|nr:MarR family transcriptional regulator [Paenibacillus curdlanolyticus]EFM08609.1 transcriptional regulator, MarR family [Paenibacillus curdlanolyticus YK9]
MYDPSIETIELEMALLLRRITFLSNRKLGNLDRSAYLLLHYIAAHGPAGVKAMADGLHLDISTVSRQAAALEQKGYVYKVQDPNDRRSYELHKTELGNQMLAQFKEIRLNFIQNMLSEWPEEDRERFGELLGKFNQSFLDAIPQE